jgi:predicted MFS family arabinose efflux permease
MFQKKNTASIFSQYEKFLIALLAVLQFTVILDFMVLSPLGAVLLNELDINASQFGLVVSAYAFSAGISGVLSAGFADKFDRKKFLLFFYAGFLIGTVCCALAETYNMLLIARIVTGIFGGVIGSICFAISTDLFKVELRGRVMGYLQMAFAASQVLGIPIGLKLAEIYGWYSSFWMIVIFGIPLGITIMVLMKPINAHLQIQTKKNAFRHLVDTVKNKEHLRAYFATVLLATGGFMMMPFGSAYSTNNLGLNIKDLPMLFGVTGIFTIIMGPLIGKFSDKIGRFKMFLGGSALSIIIISIYTHIGITPFYLIILLNVVMFMGITARIISSSALISTVPKPENRGAFMSINASIQQMSGGLASALAGVIVVKTPSGYLERYDILGYVVIASMVIASIFIYNLDRYTRNKAKLETMAKNEELAKN